jgi:hypothetical protein
MSGEVMQGYQVDKISNNDWLSAVQNRLLRLLLRVLTALIASSMYRAIGKKVAFIYPNPAMSESDIPRYHAIVNDAEPSPWHGLHCLKTVGRASNYNADDIARLKASGKAEIAFYCQLNPTFAEGTALLVLIPVNLKQLLFTGWKWLIGIN